MGENIKAMPTGHMSGKLEKESEFGIKINLIQPPRPEPVGPKPESEPEPELGCESLS